MPRNVLIQVRRGDSSDWSTVNPVLASGEPGYETDSGSLKIGDGFTAYNSLSSISSYMDGMPVGIEWDTSSNSPTLTKIDVNGNVITPTVSFFDNHAIWGRIRRCVRNRTTGAISYGTNPRGDGLTLDGTTGDVLVEIPNAK